MLKDHKILYFFSIDQLIRARLHIGSSVRIWNSDNFFFLLGYRKGLFIINLFYTVFNLRNALLILEKYTFSGLTTCFVLQNYFLQSRVARELDVYLNYGISYFTKKWMPGFISNFKVFNLFFRLNLVTFENLSNWGRKKMGLKWFGIYDRFKGLRRCNIMPSMLCLLTPNKNIYSFDEALKLFIPIISVSDSDLMETNLSTIIIPGSDDSKSGLLFFLMIFKSSFFVGLLKKRVQFLFLVNTVLYMFRKYKLSYMFHHFLFLYFFLRSFFIFLF